MKLIRKPKIKKDVNKLECKECGAVYSCTKGELKFRRDDRDGSYYEFKCPSCKEITTYDVSLII